MLMTRTLVVIAQMSILQYWAVQLSNTSRRNLGASSTVNHEMELIRLPSTPRNSSSPAASESLAFANPAHNGACGWARLALWCQIALGVPRGSGCRINSPWVGSGFRSAYHMLLRQSITDRADMKLPQEQHSRSDRLVAT